MTSFRTIAVLGAGTMGAQIAAHFANAGFPVLLLDVTADAARDGLKRARALKPDPFFTPMTAALITTGGFDDGSRAAQRRRLDPRSRHRTARRQTRPARTRRSGAAPGHGRQLEHVRHSDSRRSPRGAATNSAATGSARTFSTRRDIYRCSKSFRLRIRIASVVERVSRFADLRLGKGVVVAKDTPNFIANRIGLYGVIQVMRALEAGSTHHRRDRRDHGTGARPPEERHVPDDGHRGTRRARPRHHET